MCGKILFRIIANNAHKPTPAKLNEPTLINMPPNPTVSTELTITRFRGCIKSTFASIKVFRPNDAMVPNKRIMMPPMTGMGMDARKALNLPKKEN